MSTALVLAGGGVTGIAWETGVLLGMREAGIELTPDLVIGTSAGSTVGAQLLSGVDLADLYAAQVGGDHQELTPELDLERLIAHFAELGDISGGLDEALRRKVGAFAKETTTVPVEVRREVIAWRLPSHDWPALPFQVTTVDADTGELLVLTASSGVALVDAVAASCAVPGVWPPLPLLDRVLIDGGLRSPTNLDLAAGHDEVIALVPLSGPGLTGVLAEAEALRGRGARVHLVMADQESTEAMGPNPLDPSRRAGSAAAGLRQGRLVEIT